MIAIQITQIDNGWIVAISNPKTREQSAHYCASYEEVTACLKAVWPSDINPQ